MSIHEYDDLSPEAAVALQRELRSRIQLTPLDKPVTTIGGADISFNKYSEVVYAGIIVLSFPDLKPVAEASTVATVRFPYIPGLLAFREIPALTEVWDQLEIKPDVLVLDGHGIAHPRRMGIATHFGLVTETPTIGCGKSRLTGKYEEPGDEPGSSSDLIHKGEKIGEVLRTKKRCNPVFVSPGNLITMEESLDLIKKCVSSYRIPEPTRLAHLLVNRIRLANKDTH